MELYVVWHPGDGMGRWIGAETQVALSRYFGPHDDAERLFSAGSDGWLRAWNPVMPGPFAGALPNADRLHWQGTVLSSVHDASGWVRSAAGIRHFEHSVGKVESYRFGTAVANRDGSVFAVRHDLDDKAISKKLPHAAADLRARATAVSGQDSWIAIAWWPVDWNKGESAVSLWRRESYEVMWLRGAPRAPNRLAFFKEELLAAGGNDALAIWHVADTEPQNGTPKQLGIPPIQALELYDRGYILIGTSMGTIELRRIDALERVVARTERVVGAVRQILTMPDGTIVSVDIEAVRWFDDRFSLRGLLLDTAGRQRSAWSVAADPAGTSLAVAMHGGGSVIVPVGAPTWAAEAQRRAGPRAASNAAADREQ